jgi:hypothetical protein
MNRKLFFVNKKSGVSNCLLKEWWRITWLIVWAIKKINPE